jgi:hypothetical protein
LFSSLTLLPKKCPNNCIGVVHERRKVIKSARRTCLDGDGSHSDHSSTWRRRRRKRLGTGFYRNLLMGVRGISLT